MIRVPSIPARGQRVSASWCASVVDFQRSAALQRGRGYRLRQSTAGVSLSINVPRVVPQAEVLPRPFGILEIDQATAEVSLRRGLIIHGQTLIEVPAGVILVAGGTADEPTFGGVRYTYGGTAELISATVSEMPVPTDATWEQPLFAAYRQSGQVVIAEVLWDSIIVLPGAFAPA